MPIIGIAGVTIPGAIDCINKINQKANNYFKPYHLPEIILNIPSFGPIHEAQNENRWDIVENRLVESIELLMRSGASIIIIPANTVHKVIAGVKRRVSIPVISILDVVAEECQRLHFKKVGIMGTSWTAAEHLYETPLKIRHIEECIPSIEDQTTIQKAIFEELIPTGKTNSKTLSSLLLIADKFKKNNCNGIVLACTELPLILNKENCGIEVIDSTAILAEAVLQKIST